MSTPAIQKGDVLHAPLWPEPVRVIDAQAKGRFLRVQATGTRTQRSYDCLLSSEDLARVQVVTPSRHEFSGDSEAFFLALEAHRIRMAYQFDPLFAVHTAQVDPLPHQIEAVYHYFLRSPRIRFLLADDPGAGKTIMAGLLIKELKYRGLAQRTLIVVPGHLKDQWRREMAERFEESFIVVGRDVMEATWGRNVWQDQPQIITSMDFAKQDGVLAALAETHWDLVIVDEAHKLAAYRYGDKTNKTDRYRLGELLSRTSQSLLLLTATPHRGDPENFRLFLDLLVPGMFANEDLLLESVQQGENPLFLRRLKEDLRDFEGQPLFPPRCVVTRSYRLSDAEKRLYNAVTEYVEKTYNKALAAEKRNVAFALLILQRRLASSVYAVRRSLERRKARLEDLLKLGCWLVDDGHIDEDAFEDMPEEELVQKETELVEQLTAAETREELGAEIRILAELLHLAHEAERQESETKLRELRQVIEEERIRQSGEKLLIFTEFRDTLEYLAAKLKQWGYSVAILHGGMPLDERIRAEHEFRERAQVMISTEAGGEGINLQFCSLMVNYDIPWNPNRLEQRIGRVHRYGQRKEVHVYNLVATDTREGAVLKALFDKLERIRRAMGSDRVFDVIGEVVPGRSLKDLIVQAIANRRTLDDIVRQIQAVPDVAAVEKVRQAALEALATRHIDLQRILGEDRRAREHRLMPEYIERFFERAFRYFFKLTPERRRDGLWRLPSVPYELRNVSQTFKNRFGEVHREYNKFAFDKSLARRHTAAFVAPGHPLLESLIEHVLEQSRSHLQRGAVFGDPDERFDGWLYFVQGEVHDGNGLTVAKRLFVVYCAANGEFRVVNSSILWDLVPQPPISALDDCPPTEDVVMFAADCVLEAYRAEIAQQRQREASIREKYGLRSLDYLIAEANARLIDYEARRSRGETVPEVEINNEQRRLEDYRTRRRALEEEIHRQTSLSVATPDVLGVARVLPLRQTTQALAMRADAEIEATGMQVALAHERAQGRTPTDVSAENLGYDICSTDAAGGVRYIEVKARAITGNIVLTPNEWLMAQRLGDEYWLYVVENAATAPVLRTIQNPAAKLCPQEVTEVVRYVIDDWAQAVEQAP